MTSFDETETTENENMVPMEVDGDGNNGVPKGEAFLDEFKANGDDDSVSFLPNLFSTSKTNQTSGYRILFRKCHVLVGIITVASVFFTVAFWGRLRKPVLRFRLEDSSSYYSHSHYSEVASNQTFKIMHITDIHLGEAENTEWGPKQDEKTFRLLEKIFQYEPDCDLIVLGGDQLTANNCLGNCTKYYETLGRFLSGYGVPWATIMGNHDDMDFEVEDGSGATVPHSYTRRDLLRVDRSFPLSLSQSSAPSELTGVTNYVLDVLDPITNKPALQIFFLDSGGGSLREAINDDQIKWFREKAGASTDEITSIPAVAFQHIPTRLHAYVDGNCFGDNGDGEIDQLDYDAGIVDAMYDSGRFHFLAVGHNHGNDYCCHYNNAPNNKNSNYYNVNQDSNTDLYFCFGRHSGYGGYGSWDRGVRIYELMLSADDEYEYDEHDEITKEFKWRTWVSDNGSEETALLVHVATYTAREARSWVTRRSFHEIRSVIKFDFLSQI